MTPRDQNQSTEAERTVFSNLDLEPGDLGVQNDADLDLDTGDEGDDGLDDLSVSHTPERQEQEPPRRESNQQQGREQQRQQPPKPLPRNAEVRTDNKGNLVDAQGKVVARAGAEARLYQRAHTATQQAEGLKRQNEDVTNRLNRAIEIGTDLHSRLQQYQGRDQQIQQLGVKPEHFASAIELWKSLHSDTAGTIRKLLTKAAADGINLAELGTPNGGQFDAKSLMDLVREEINKGMNPLIQRSQAEAAQQRQSAEQQRLNDEAVRETQTFFNANPEAREYLPVFQQLIQHPEHGKMSLGEMWARIQLNLLRNGNGQGRTRQNRRNPSLPSGRGGPQGGTNDVADISSSYDDIIKGVLSTAGIDR